MSVRHTLFIIQAWTSRCAESCKKLHKITLFGGFLDQPIEHAWGSLSAPNVLPNAKELLQTDFYCQMHDLALTLSEGLTSYLWFSMIIDDDFRWHWYFDKDWTGVAIDNLSSYMLLPEKAIEIWQILRRQKEIWKRWPTFPENGFCSTLKDRVM